MRQVTTLAALLSACFCSLSLSAAAQSATPIAPQQSGAVQASANAAEATTELSVALAPPAANYTDAGDLPALQERGKLRILVPSLDERNGYLPREGSPLTWQQQVAEDFARSLDLEPILISMTELEHAVPSLLAGKVDLIAANLTVTEERRRYLSFSAPFAYVREQVLVRADDDQLNTPADLNGRTITVDPSSAFWETVQQLKLTQPDIKVKAARMQLDESLVDAVASGEIDVTVHQSNLIEVYQQYRDDVRVAFDLARNRPVGWAMRPDATKLTEALNNYLQREQLLGESRPVSRGDWAEIKARGVLRVLLRNNAVSYFLWRGELVGFEYELLERFAKQHKLRLDVVVPESHAGLFNGLRDGRADIAAGFLSPTEQRRTDIDYSASYYNGAQMLIAREDDAPADLADLAGRTVVVRTDSAYWQPLERLIASGIELNLEPAPDNLETEQIMLRVAKGKYDLTVAGGPVGDMPQSLLPGVKAIFPLGEPQPNAWAVRSSNPELLDKVNEFVAENRRGKRFFNIIWNKYFNSRGRVAKLTKEAAKPRPDGSLSPYDKYVRTYADRYNFDWRLIVSQMYQESRFDPKQKSWAGAVGLMQVMPRTAKQMGFTNVKHPDSGIHAGVKYLAWLRKQIDADLPYRTRTWFTLASYNAGLGHVIDARRLAEQKGWDSNRWFGHVEKAMLLLQQPKYAKKARHGYVRGTEPVNYVRNIRARYDAYVRLTNAEAQAAEQANDSGRGEQLETHGAQLAEAGEVATSDRR